MSQPQPYMQGGGVPASSTELHHTPPHDGGGLFSPSSFCLLNGFLLAFQSAFLSRHHEDKITALRNSCGKAHEEGTFAQKLRHHLGVTTVCHPELIIEDPNPNPNTP